jgi:serine/threonine protein kinase
LPGNAPQKVTMADLEKVSILGSGAFGQVMLVRYQGKAYALKVLNKSHIVQMGLQVRSEILT